MKMQAWYKNVGKAMFLTAVLISAFVVSTPAEALRVHSSDWTLRTEPSPQVIWTIYNDTNRSLKAVEITPQYSFSDGKKELSDIHMFGREHGVSSPGGGVEYTGLIAPWPSLCSSSEGNLGQWGFNINNTTHFSFIVQGDTRGYTTPYDIGWLQTGAGVLDSRTRPGDIIPNTKDLKVVDEDKMLRYGLQGDDGTWYVITLLLGQRGDGELGDKTAHLIMTVQNASTTMRTVNI